MHAFVAAHSYYIKTSGQTFNKITRIFHLSTAVFQVEKGQTKGDSGLKYDLKVQVG